MKKRIKVLALGYLPKWRGGLQQTGLATGLFDLHNTVNELEQNVEVVIAATDVFKEEVQVDHTRVLGWSKVIIIKHALKRIHRVLYFACCNIRFLKFKPAFRFWDNLAKQIFLDYAIERERPDIVHLHGCLYALYYESIWQKDIPKVLRIHGLNGYNETYDMMLHYRKIEKYITRHHFKWVTFLTQSNKEEWLSKYGGFPCPTYVFLNGYNQNIFKLSSEIVEKKFDLIEIAGISENKGQRRVLQALKKMKDDGLPLSYLIIGSGNEMYVNELKEYATENQLDVTWLLYVAQTELPHFIYQSTFFIMPSVTEGFGKVFVESLACGTPVILPQTLPIALEKGLLSKENAIFLDNENTEGIYEGLKKIKQLRYNANDVAKTVSTISWQSIAKEYINLYGKVL